MPPRILLLPCPTFFAMRQLWRWHARLLSVGQFGAREDGGRNRLAWRGALWRRLTFRNHQPFVMAYTAHSDYTSAEPPTFVVVGEQESVDIYRPSSVKDTGSTNRRPRWTGSCFVILPAAARLSTGTKLAGATRADLPGAIRPCRRPTDSSDEAHNGP